MTVAEIMAQSALLFAEIRRLEAWMADYDRKFDRLCPNLKTRNLWANKTEPACQVGAEEKTLTAKRGDFSLPAKDGQIATGLQPLAKASPLNDQQIAVSGQLKGFKIRECGHAAGNEPLPPVELDWDQDR